MAGFLAALIPILGLGLGGIELAHWMGLRQTLSLALMDAARAGTTRQASPQAIADAFEQGLRAIYVQPAAHARALQTRRHALGAPWQIRIRQPTAAAFLDHAAALPDPRPTPARVLIRNDYQAAQHASRVGQGWPEGRGPRSGLTIFEANTLLMDLWWPQAPLAPGVAAIVRALAPLHGDPIGRRMMESGYLPFRRRIRLAMQSHPAAWPDLPDGRVIHEGAATALPPGVPDGQPDAGAGTLPAPPGGASAETRPDAGQPPPTNPDELETDIKTEPMEEPGRETPSQEADGAQEACAP